MISKPRFYRPFNTVFVYLILIILGVFFTFPFFWMISNSLKSNAAIFRMPINLIPDPVEWSNYSNMMEVIPIGLYFTNTTIAALASSLLVLVFPPMAAYAFSKMRWAGREKVFLLVSATLMIPFQVRMVPLFILFTRMGWTRTLLPLIIPRLADPVYIFLVRQFFMSTPDDLVEAAKIDGCNHFRIFFQLMMPLIKPVLITVLIYEIVYQWNDFLRPMIFLRSDKLYTLGIGLYNFMDMYEVRWNLMMAATAVFIIPLIVMYVFCQKFFIEGIASQGIKA